MTSKLLFLYICIPVHDVFLIYQVLFLKNEGLMYPKPSVVIHPEGIQLNHD